MKSAIALILAVISLNACALGPGEVTKESLALTQPDVQGVDKETQAKAADEVEGGQCEALATLAQVCLPTRDQARALSVPAR